MARKERNNQRNTRKIPSEKKTGGIFGVHKKRVLLRPDYRKKQSNTSIYFLIWSIFSAIALFIVLSLGISQIVVMKQTYRNEASREVAQKGQRIEAEILQGIPEPFGDNFSGYLRFLSTSNGVDLYILNKDGYVLFPQEQNFDPSAPELSDVYDFSDEMEKMISKMRKTQTKTVIFETGDMCVYGSEFATFNESSIYLYVGKSMNLATVATAKMTGRMVMIAVFVFLLSFAVSSAISGWLAKPISEMTSKAKQLARGNFAVDFRGVDYGQEMVELADSLNFARDELSKTDNMQKELIANVSHDFKTPLTMIKAYASMIMEISGDIPEKRNKHAQVIVDEADRLASLVADVLDLSKMNSGLETLRQDVFNMSKETFEILNRFAYLKETGGYQFITEIEDGLHTCADRLKIEQVLYNLIGNAVNYTGEDKKVYVQIKKESADTFRFSVTDTGKGIKQEEFDFVWDRYYRSSEMHKRPVRGTGLGLSIVKKVLEKHNFHFGIRSKVGKGSTFYVVFPLVEVVQDDDDLDV
jgi:signal transduction histidine kinase